MPRRWAHTQQVAATAQESTEALGLDGDVVVSAAWLHDVGYAPTVAVTGFHPLDGTRYLRDAGWSLAVVGLVAHHSCAQVEADARGHGDSLRTFPDVPGLERDVLWASDATTGPDGSSLAVGERVLEVVARYGRHDLVSACMVSIALELAAASQRVAQRRAGLPVAMDLCDSVLLDVPTRQGITEALSVRDPLGTVAAGASADDHEPVAWMFSQLLAAGFELDASMVVAVWEKYHGPSSVFAAGASWTSWETAAADLRRAARVDVVRQPMYDSVSR